MAKIAKLFAAALFLIAAALVSAKAQTYTSGQISPDGGKTCLDYSAGIWNVPTLNPCNGSANQLWVYYLTSKLLQAQGLGWYCLNTNDLTIGGGGCWDNPSSQQHWITNSTNGFRTDGNQCIQPTKPLTLAPCPPPPPPPYRMATQPKPKPVAVNGVCGPSNGQSFPSAPSTGLCNPGTATALTGMGPWAWTCSGINGGTTASCTAQLTLPPPPTQAHQLGVFVGSDPTGFAAFQAFMAPRSVDYALVFGGQDNGWSDFYGSLWYSTQVWAPDPNLKLLWSAPLIAKQYPNPPIADLKTAGTGAYDTYYGYAAGDIGSRIDKAPIIRIGWEFNGGWYPWAVSSSPNGPADYVAAFRDYVKVIRTVIPNAKFMWCVATGQDQSIAEASYPGDDVVDIIAADVYEDSAWTSSDFPTRWNQVLTESSGLNWLEAFATLHNKPMAFPEWATNFDYVVGQPNFIDNMATWMKARNVVIQSWWDSDSAFVGSFATHPTNGTIYKAAFQNW